MRAHSGAHRLTKCAAKVVPNEGAKIDLFGVLCHSLAELVFPKEGKEKDKQQEENEHSAFPLSSVIVLGDIFSLSTLTKQHQIMTSFSGCRYPSITYSRIPNAVIGVVANVAHQSVV